MLHYFLISGPEGERPRDLLLAALLGSAGVAVSTGVLGTINKATGGAFQFYMLQVRLILHLSKDGNAWYRPLSAWLPGATSLLLPAAGVGELSVNLAVRQAGGGGKGSFPGRW